MDKEDIYMIEDFIIDCERQLTLLKDHITILDMPDNKKIVVEATIAMLTKKIEGVKKATSKKDLKEFIKLKKLVKDGSPL